MTIKQIKNIASDFRRCSRWASVRSAERNESYRIVGIGREKVRVMAGNGDIFSVDPADVKSVW